MLLPSQCLEMVTILIIIISMMQYFFLSCKLLPISKTSSVIFSGHNKSKEILLSNVSTYGTGNGDEFGGAP